MSEKKRKILFDRDAIQARVEKMGKEISADYGDDEVTVIPLLRGSFIFAADLVREMTCPTVIDFMTTSSYEDREESCGQVNLLSTLRCDIAGKNVLVVDDICDSGNTLKVIVDHLKEFGPSSIKTAVMLDKPSRRQVEISPDYIGESIEDVFIVGYGLNYGDHYRNVPYIFTFED